MPTYADALAQSRRAVAETVDAYFRDDPDGHLTTMREIGAKWHYPPDVVWAVLRTIERQIQALGGTERIGMVFADGFSGLMIGVDQVRAAKAAIDANA